MRQITTPVQEKNAGTRQRKPSRWMVATGTTYRTSAVVGRVATGRSIEVGFGGAGGAGERGVEGRELSVGELGCQVA